MTRGQKIQELLIQILVLWFAYSNVANVSDRPVINRGFAAIAFVVILSGFILHALNFFKNDAYFIANKLTGSKKLWISFAVGVAGIVFCLLFGLTGLLYFSPLILAYPVFYFFQHRWLPRAILLVGLICVTYSQMRLTQNDKLHALMMWMSKHPERFNSAVIKAFDRKTLTVRQAYDIANLLTLHPDESFRDYKTGLEFAQIALKKPTNPKFSKKIAYIVACAMIGDKKIENARKVASTYKIDNLQETLETKALCEPLPSPSRMPASTIRQKKYKYYF